MDYSAIIMLGTAIVGAIGTYFVTSFKVDQGARQITDLAAEVHKLQLEAAQSRAEKAETARNFDRLEKIAVQQQQNYETVIGRLGNIEGKIDQVLNK